MTVLVKDWHWRSHLGIGITYELKSQASAPMYPCTLLIRKNSRLGELGRQRFLALFGSRLALLHLRDCKEGCLWRRLCA